VLGYCAWILLVHSLSEFVTAQDSLANYRRFNPVRDGWNLGMFLSSKVKEGLRAVYERGEISTTDRHYRQSCNVSCPERETCPYYQRDEVCSNPRRVRTLWASVTKSLDEPIENEEGEGFTLGDVTPAPSMSVEEQASGKADSEYVYETLMQALRSTEDRKVLEAIQGMINDGEEVTDVVISKRTGLGRSTVTEARKRIKRKAKALGIGIK